MKRCAIENCHGEHKARGFCEFHYWQWYRKTHLVNSRNTDISGYVTIIKDGKRYLEHRRIAEQALGKALPPLSVVHHVDENASNNHGSNLVICENQAYHLLLHRRTRAVKAGYPPHFRICYFCQQFDDPENLKIQGASCHHTACTSTSKNRRIIFS